jgi:hypothetical protein
MSPFAYHPPVTLEDLGINIAPPSPHLPGGSPAPQGPPPGGCPYEKMEREAQERKKKENPSFIL